MMSGEVQRLAQILVPLKAPQAQSPAQALALPPRPLLPRPQWPHSDALLLALLPRRLAQAHMDLLVLLLPGLLVLLLLRQLWLLRIHWRQGFPEPHRRCLSLLSQNRRRLVPGMQSLLLKVQR